jgi:hypothetical protein
VKREGYRFAVRWIAENDDAGSPDARDEDTVAGYITTLLVADMFHKSPAEVAKDIIRSRP